jgi:hypothetical protein
MDHRYTSQHVPFSLDNNNGTKYQYQRRPSLPHDPLCIPSTRSRRLARQSMKALPPTWKHTLPLGSIRRARDSLKQNTRLTASLPHHRESEDPLDKGLDGHLRAYVPAASVGLDRHEAQFNIRHALDMRQARERPPTPSSSSYRSVCRLSTRTCVFTAVRTSPLIKLKAVEPPACSQPTP